MRKIFNALMVLALLLVMVGCNNSETKNKDSFKVGVVQLIQHPALDEATKGFIEALKAELGDKVTIDEQNASGEVTNCSAIVNAFIANKVDLIMANATAALQAAASATADIPVLGTSITDYASALELDNWTGTVGNNVSGTSDLAPLDQQAKIVKDLFPDAKTVGILYCSSETNSQYQVDVISKEFEKLNLEVKAFTFTDSNDVTSVAQLACAESDVIYIPTDNTVASNTEAIANVVIPEKKAVITGEEGTCKGCGVATLSISYYDLGYTTGLMAAKILRGEANPQDMPVEFASEFKNKYNPKVCEQLGINPPEGYEKIEIE